MQAINPLYNLDQSIFVMDWDIEAGKINLSDNWLKMLGYRPGSLPTVQWFSSLIHPEDQLLILMKFEKKLSNLDDGETEFTFRLKAADGSYYTFQSRAMVVMSNIQGLPCHMIWANQAAPSYQAFV
jgi:PAS domain-containing protein